MNFHLLSSEDQNIHRNEEKGFFEKEHKRLCMIK
jgi:hypothetical protein